MPYKRGEKNIELYPITVFIIILWKRIRFLVQRVLHGRPPPRARNNFNIKTRATSEETKKYIHIYVYELMIFIIIFFPFTIFYYPVIRTDKKKNPNKDNQKWGFFFFFTYVLSVFAVDFECARARIGFNKKIILQFVFAQSSTFARWVVHGSDYK